MVESTNSAIWRDLMSKHGRSTSSPRSENKRNRIQSWLMQEGWKIAELQAPDTLWVISGTNEAGHSIIIAQLIRIQDCLSIHATVTIGEDHQKLLAAMEPKERESLWWDLRMGLLKSGVDFLGLAEPVKVIEISQRIYDDGLTKDRFLQRVTKVKAGQILVMWSIAKALQQPPSDDVLGSDFVQ